MTPKYIIYYENWHPVEDKWVLRDIKATSIVDAIKMYQSLTLYERGHSRNVKLFELIPLSPQ